MQVDFPQIIAEPRLGEDLVNEELPIEDIVDAVCARSVKINVVTVQNLELIGQASVRSILCDGSDIPPFPDKVEDMAVAHMWLWSRRFRRLGGGEHGQPVNTDGHGGGGGLGVTVDLPNLVHGLANELEAREGPLLALLKTHITQEMRSLKDEIFARGGISAPCGMADPARGRDAGILNSGSPITVPRVQTRNPVVSSDTSTGCGGAEQQKHRGGQLDDGTSESAKTTQFSGGNGRGATPHPGGPITNEVAPLDSVDHCPAMGEAREDGGEETSTSDGGHGKNDYGSAKNLEIIPPPNDDTSKEDCSAPPSPSEESEPTSMDVQLQPHSSPIKDATLPNDRSQSRRLLTPTLPNVPLGGAAVLISIEKGETKGNPNPSEAVQKRTSKRLHILFVPFSPPQPPPKKIKGKGGRKKTGKHEIRQLKAANAKLMREGNCVQHTEVDAGDNVATVDATKKVEVELIKAGEREKILRHCLTISWVGFIIAIAIIASRCLK
ncbi:BnaAnng09690D [Brassica napus]|uniref:BnaAnng09690D protein n=1 Tax=Brassica napus TaxID=3708 RepID=A0A078IBZ8_BRANA|nr:BnaAnng09690D [Brassica napus]